MLRCDIQRLAVCPHHLSGGASGLANGILPAGNPFLLDGRLLSIRKPIFMVVHKKRDCEHVTVQSLMTGMLASSTDDTRKEWMVALIGSEGTALRASCTRSGRATVARDEATACILLATSSRRPTVLITVAVPIAVAAIVGPVTALIQRTDTGSVALHVTVGELICFNRVPVLARA